HRSTPHHVALLHHHDTTTTLTSTLSLHDALPISATGNVIGGTTPAARNVIGGDSDGAGVLIADAGAYGNMVIGNYIGTDVRDERSEEHTSELQSHLKVVCRLLLEKKKKQNQKTH